MKNWHAQWHGRLSQIPCQVREKSYRNLHVAGVHLCKIPEKADLLLWNPRVKSPIAEKNIQRKIKVKRGRQKEGEEGEIKKDGGEEEEGGGGGKDGKGGEREKGEEVEKDGRKEERKKKSWGPVAHPVILTAREAEIRRILVWSQPQGK
jgi:hypothetical protein